MTEAAVATTPAKKGRKPKDGAKKAKAPSHPPTLQMITTAMQAEKDPKGVSVMAIKKYILAHYKVESRLLKSMLKRALATGLKEGKLTRPHGQASSAVLSGRYRLASKTSKTSTTAAPKPKTAKKSPAKKAATKKTPVKKAKTPKKKPAAAKAKSPKAVKKTPKKPAAKKTAAKKKTPKKTKTPKKA